MKNITRRLGKTPPFYFVLIYIILILIFTTIYYALPDRSFYHSTSKYEFSELNEDALNILNNIKKSIINTNIEYYGDSIINLKGWKANINQIQIHSLQVENFPKEIGFKMNIDVNHVKGIWTTVTATLKIDMQEKIIQDDLILCTINSDYKPIQIDDTISVPDFKSFFQVPTDNMIQLHYPTLILTAKVWSDLIYFGQCYRGFPNREVSGQWFRMFYLSAGIATSTSIGDIVPLTLLSRLLITMQGILAIIIISLFFNALAFNISNLPGKNEFKRKGRKKKDEGKTIK